MSIGTLSPVHPSANSQLEDSSLETADGQLCAFDNFLFESNSAICQEKNTNSSYVPRYDW